VAIVLTEKGDSRRTAEHMAMMRRAAAERLIHWRKWLERTRPTPSERHRDIDRMIRKRRERYG